MAQFFWISRASDDLPVGIMYDTGDQCWLQTFSDSRPGDAASMGIVFSGPFVNRENNFDLFLQELENRGLAASGPANLPYKKGKSQDLRERVAEKLGIDPYPGETRPQEVDSEPATDDLRQKFSGMKDFVKARVLGQDAAVDAICDAVIAALLGLKADPDSPDVVLFLLGPSGVGKTEVVKVISEFLKDTFGKDDYPFLRFDMNDYQQSHTGSRLTGSPPGYVGYDDGGVLTRSLAKNDRSVVLLDEIGNGHEDVLTVLMTAFDEGYLTPQNPKEKKIDCRRTLFFATANYNASKIRMGRSKTGFTDDVYGAEDVNAAAREGFEKHLPPQLRGRVDDVVYFDALDDKTLRKIADGMIAAAVKTAEKYGLQVTLSDDAMDVVVNCGREPLEGARHLKKAIKKLVNPVILQLALTSNPKKARSIRLDANADRTGLRVAGADGPERQVA